MAANAAHEKLTHTEPSYPNFVFILTDDQDQILDGMLPMTKVKELIGDEGVTFKNSFVASPLCCPSRSSILTGQYVHNHGSINNSVSGQCSGPTWQSGPEKRTFAVHLQRFGYQTFFAGKYLNQYGFEKTGGVEHVPPGWDWWNGLKGNSVYYNYVLSVNGTPESHGQDPCTDYLTDVIRRRAIEFLGNVDENKPFLMMMSTPAAHAPFTPEPKYAANFSSRRAPRTLNFNIKNDHTKHWLLREGIQPLPDDVVDKIDDVYRNRLRTLLTVDDMVRDVVDLLNVKKLLNNTYVIFTSDNGFHLGQFSLPIDKREPYESDIRVPFMMRGPGIPKGKILNYPISNIDIAPTLLSLAGAEIPKSMDGKSLKPYLFEDQKGSSDSMSQFVNEVRSSGRASSRDRNHAFSSLIYRRTLLVEHSGEGHLVNKGCESKGEGLSGCNPNFACKCEDSWNNTYSCLRHINSEENYLFCKWKDNENFQEYYDLNNDEYEMNNTVHLLVKQRYKKLGSLMKHLKQCKGPRCSELSAFVL
ncbi:N-acetylglucosamine-6-sulfatase-like isoform X2 [Oratosquilla oratoria]|uniref:N-acetylglucosamine-6-sulfatase-like isoform X2 n=1 Tax=Oratosquilla oratoria TaxID=337810 RepID=UPI003F75839B